MGKSITVNCDNCGDEFRAYRCKLKLYKRHFCCIRCKAEWMSMNMKGSNNPTYKPEIKNINCKHCNREFRKSLHVTNNGRGIFCSKKCYNAFRKKFNRENPKQSAKKIEHICHYCSGLFKDYQSKKKKFCSFKCLTKSKTAKQFSFKPKENYRSAEWRQSRAVALKIDGYECMSCKAITNLHAHHIIPFKISGNNSWRNLVILCASCHRKYEGNDDKLIRLFDSELAAIAIRKNCLLRNFAEGKLEEQLTLFA